jgi:hypothetical protein
MTAATSGVSTRIKGGDRLVQDDDRTGHVVPGGHPQLPHRGRQLAGGQDVHRSRFTMPTTGGETCHPDRIPVASPWSGWCAKKPVSHRCRMNLNPLIFINYRSDDQALAASLLDRELSHRYGPDQVFLDTRSLVAGRVFDTGLLSAVRNCAVLIAVIGQNWLTTTDEHGRRLIDRRQDWVRMEIAQGLERGVPVIPILLEDVPPLIPAALPPSIRRLAKHQFVPLRHRSFRSDFEYLITQLSTLNPVFNRDTDNPDRRAS